MFASTEVFSDIKDVSCVAASGASTSNKGLSSSPSGVHIFTSLYLSTSCIRKLVESCPSLVLVWEDIDTALEGSDANFSEAIRPGLSFPAFDLAHLS